MSPSARSFRLLLLAILDTTGDFAHSRIASAVREAQARAPELLCDELELGITRLVLGAEAWQR